jgi:hypothetical protein
MQLSQVQIKNVGSTDYPTPLRTSGKCERRAGRVRPRGLKFVASYQQLTIGIENIGERNGSACSVGFQVPHAKWDS